MINVLHLYYDLLNLYGENGNTRCIVNNLKNNNIKVNVDLKSINDKINFNKYDIIYIGSGSENDLKFALSDLLKRKDDIKKYIENDKYLFLTGNSMDMFGKYIEDDNNRINALDIFDYHSKFINEKILNNAAKDRVVGETYSECDLIKEKIIGFQNRCDLVYNVKTPLFKTNENYSNDLKNKNEGFTYKNVYATHTIGPLFIRNPYLIDYFLEKICNEKNLNYNNKNELAYLAYKKYLGN